MKIARAAPHPAPLRGATLPARGRDARPRTRRFAATLVQPRTFGFKHRFDATPIPPLYGEGVARRATGGVRPRKENVMANERARALRKTMTPQEVKLWVCLRRLRPQGFHFRRQAPLEGYILDFVCFKHRLIVEVDGGQHGFDAGLAHDALRDAHFAALGFLTLRFWNHDVDMNLDGVVETIFSHAETQGVRHG
jgi:very-short-patch-repair endonuclease